MPWLPRVSADELIKILKIFGFVFVRQKGSHMVFKKEERGCVVPYHKELATGTLRNILRQAGISEEDFMKAYRE